MNLPQKLEKLAADVASGRIREARQAYDNLNSHSAGFWMSEEHRRILEFHGAGIDLMEGNYDGALTRAEAALKVFSDTGSRTWIARCHLLLCAVLLRMSSYQRAGEHAEAAAYFYAWEIDDPRRKSESYDKLGTVHKNLGSWDAAERSFRKALRSCGNTSDPLPNLRSSLNLAILLRKMGKIQEASSICREGLALSRRHGIDLGTCRYALELANICLVRGDTQTCSIHLDTAGEIADGNQYRREKTLACEIRGDLLAAKREHEAAFATYTEAMELAREFAPAGDLEYEIMRRTAATSLELGRIAEAREIVSEAIGMVLECGDQYEYGICLRILGQLEIAEGLRGIAVSHLRESVLVLSELSKWCHELATSEVALAGTCDTDRPVEALGHMLTARRICSSLGLHAAVQDIDDWISSRPLGMTFGRTYEGRVKEECEPAGIHGLNLAGFGLITRDERIAGDIARWGSTDVRVLIEGETGVGKELVARTLHALSRRRENRFVAVDCGALSETLADSELFGHVKGSFTGALRDRIGLIEEADGGTLLLDEVGDLSEMLQTKLLRVLEEAEVRRVGENRSRPVDIRLLSATAKNLGQAVEEGRFRRDLYYRLKGVLVRVPSLRERRRDIDLLLDYFLELQCDKQEISIRLTSACRKMIHEYRWPGNVRELKNTVEALVASSKDGAVIHAGSLERFLVKSAYRGRPRGRLKDMELEEIERVLSACEGNKSKAARLLGITRKTLYSKLNGE